MSGCVIGVYIQPLNSVSLFVNSPLLVIILIGQGMAGRDGVGGGGGHDGGGDSANLRSPQTDTSHSWLRWMSRGTNIQLQLVVVRK